jgi:hypothetical protein
MFVGIDVWDFDHLGFPLLVLIFEPFMTACDKCEGAHMASESGIQFFWFC